MKNGRHSVAAGGEPVVSGTLRVTLAGLSRRGCGHEFKRVCGGVGSGRAGWK